MSWADVGKLVLGATLALGGGVLTELWRGRRDLRGAARVLLQELTWNFGVLVSCRVQMTEGTIDFTPGPLITDARLKFKPTFADLKDDAWKALESRLAANAPVDVFQTFQTIYMFLRSCRTLTEVPLGHGIDEGLVAVDEAIAKCADLAGVKNEAELGRQVVRLTARLEPNERKAALKTYHGLLAQGSSEHEIREYLDSIPAGGRQTAPR
jgi:hypothetical protein